MENGNLSLRFNNHLAILVQSLTDFFTTKKYGNVTLVYKGEQITAHQEILAACSSFFDKLLKGNSNNHRHPIIIFNDVSKEQMMHLLEFMYTGKVKVPVTTIPSILKIAKDFKIKGFEHENLSENGVEVILPQLEDKLVKNSEENHQPLRTSMLNKEIIENLSENGVEVILPQLEDRAMKNSEENHQPLRTSMSNKEIIVKEPESSVNNTTSQRKKSRSEPKSKVMNPFARNRGNHADSNSTFGEEDLARPGPSTVEAHSPPTRNSDSDVEIIDSNSSSSDINRSPVLFRNTQPRKKRKMTRNDSDTVGSLSKNINKTITRDFEGKNVEEKEMRVNQLGLTNRNGKEEPNSSSAAAEEDDISIAMRLLKKKKYSSSYSAEENIKLLKLPFHKLRNYCVVCLRFYKDLDTHLKETHKKPPRKKITCKKCSKLFYHKAFLGFHKCKSI